MGISQEVCLHHIDHTLAAVPARLISSSTRGMPNPTRPVSLLAPPLSPDSALLSCSSYIIATTIPSKGWTQFVTKGQSQYYMYRSEV